MRLFNRRHPILSKSLKWKKVICATFFVIFVSHFLLMKISDVPKLEHKQKSNNETVRFDFYNLLSWYLNSFPYISYANVQLFTFPLKVISSLSFIHIPCYSSLKPWIGMFLQTETNAAKVFDAPLHCYAFCTVSSPLERPRCYQ